MNPYIGYAIVFFFRLSRFKFTFEDQYAASFLYCDDLAATSAVHKPIVNEETLFITHLSTLTIFVQVDSNFILGSCRRHIVLVEDCYRREALSRPDIALGSPGSALLKCTLDRLLVVHFESRIGSNQHIVMSIVICCYVRFQGCVGIQCIARMSLYTLGAFVQTAHAHI